MLPERVESFFISPTFNHRRLRWGSLLEPVPGRGNDQPLRMRRSLPIPQQPTTRSSETLREAKTPLVISLNPAVDAEWRVDRVRWEEKNVLESENRWAGGKGINVARWLRHLGSFVAPVLLSPSATQWGRGLGGGGAFARSPRFKQSSVRLLLPLGGELGHELARGLAAEKFDTTVVPIRGASRINVVVTTAVGSQIRFNQPGPVLSPAEWKSVIRRTELLLPRTSSMIISGSLPRGVPTDAYALLVRAANRAGVPAVVDCDGPALRAAGKARPLLVKPNRYELAQWAGHALNSERAIIKAARALAAVTHGWVLVSRGKEGGLLVGAQSREVFFARPPRLKPVSTVGAGDALLAAAVRQIEAGAPPIEWLRWGVAVGAAATQCTGGKVPPRALIRDLLSRVVLRRKIIR
jgi:1-phosphofructokinase family hexose kinase